MRRRAVRDQLRDLPLVIAFIAVGLGFAFAPGITSIALGGLLYALAIVCLVGDWRLGRSGRRVAGTVVGHRQEEDCFFPIIEFQDKDGNLRRETTGTGRGVKKPPVGSRVVVVYGSPAKRGCEINRFWRRKGAAVALFVLGSIFTLGAILGR